MFKIRKIEKYLASHKEFGILLLRTFVGCRLFYGVIDNVLNWEQMTEFSNFLEAHNFPFPLMSAVTSVYVQFIGAILILFGYKSRLASFLLSINFIIAIFFVHIRANDSVEGMTPALAMLFGCLTLLFTGADRISLDHYFNSK